MAGEDDAHHEAHQAHQPQEAHYTLALRRVYAAAPERVFQSLTDPDALKRWFGPEGFIVVMAEVDLRPGGVYRLGLQDTQDNVRYLSGVYRDLQAPARLAFTWAWEYDPPSDPATQEAHMLVTIEIVDRGQMSDVHLTHERLPSAAAIAQHQAGWNSSLDNLDAYLS
jgi:uncharacterized protein YndB with AHSA1/START domain